MQNVENANAEMRHENGWILHILGRESALIMWAESRHYACHSTTYFCRHYAKAFSTYCIRFCRKAAVKCRCRRVQIGDILSANFSKLFVGPDKQNVPPIDETTSQVAFRHVAFLYDSIDCVLFFFVDRIDSQT